MALISRGKSNTADARARILAWINVAKKRGIPLSRVAVERGKSGPYITMMLKRHKDLCDIAIANGVYNPNCSGLIAEKLDGEIQQEPHREVECEIVRERPKLTTEQKIEIEKKKLEKERIEREAREQEKARRSNDIKRILVLLEQGERLEVCCACQGISRQKLQKWANEDPELWEQLAQAQAKFRLWAATQLRKAITVAAQKGAVSQIVNALARKYPAEYAPVKYVDIEMKSKLEIEQKKPDLSSLSDEQLLSLLDKVKQ